MAIFQHILARRVRRMPVVSMALPVVLLPAFLALAAFQVSRTPVSPLVLSTGVGVGVLLSGLLWIEGRRRAEAELANEESKQRELELGRLNHRLEKRIDQQTSELKAVQERLARFEAMMDA